MLISGPRVAIQLYQRLWPRATTRLHTFCDTQVTTWGFKLQIPSCVAKLSCIEALYSVLFILHWYSHRFDWRNNSLSCDSGGRQWGASHRRQYTSIHRYIMYVFLHLRQARTIPLLLLTAIFNELEWERVLCCLKHRLWLSPGALRFIEYWLSILF